MVKNFALAAIVGLFATATLAETTEASKKDDHVAAASAEAGKETKEEKKAENEKETEKK